MERIVFLERATFRATFRPPSFAHEWIDYAETAAASEVLERLRGATIAVCNKVALKEATLSCLPDLKLIAVAATGVDNIDLDYCRRRGLVVCNARNYARHSVPEHVLMLMLALRRNLLSYRAEVESGAWQKARQFCLLNHTIHDLNESTLGIIGYGALGRAVEALAQAVGMKTLIAERKGAHEVRRGRLSFEAVLGQSDIITLHSPLTEETRGMFGPAEFAQMRRDAILINTARGGLVDEAALSSALEAGTIAGAAFDVLSTEPPREGNPLLNLRRPNFILTPHIAWASDEAMQTLADQVVDNIEAFMRGTPQNLV